MAIRSLFILSSYYYLFILLSYYLIIYFACRFRENQDNRVQGLSHVSLKRRRNQNLVTMKFNMISWALDTLITLILVKFVNHISETVFVLIHISRLRLNFCICGGILHMRGQLQEGYTHARVFLKFASFGSFPRAYFMCNQAQI